MSRLLTGLTAVLLLITPVAATQAAQLTVNVPQIAKVKLSDDQKNQVQRSYTTMRERLNATLTQLSTVAEKMAEKVVALGNTLSSRVQIMDLIAQAKTELADAKTLLAQSDEHVISLLDTDDRKQVFVIFKNTVAQVHEKLNSAYAHLRTAANELKASVAQPRSKN